MRISTIQDSSAVLRLKKLEMRKNEKIVETEKPKYCAMKLSQIRRRIELNPSFLGELEKFSFFLTVLFNFLFYLKK
jgi:hypothetical protein